MLTVKVNLKRIIDNSYKIKIGNGVLRSLRKDLKRMGCHRVIVVTDRVVDKLHGEKVLNQLKMNDLKVDKIVIPAGEKSKSRKMKEYVEDQMFKKGCGRDACLAALGGGVVGDLTGFVAATFCRGIPYVQIPTTLLAMVDSGVGGKTGLDAPAGKNLVGALWQPRLVVADLDLLETLPKKEWFNGLVEMVKIFMVRDRRAFDEFEKLIYFQKSNPSASLGSARDRRLGVKKARKQESKIFTALIKRAVELKAEIVEKDERESGLRSVLNFGHTIGHALEKLSNYKLAHGQAVGRGMIWEARLSHKLGCLPAEDLERIVSVLEKLGVREELKFKPRMIVETTHSDKKVKTLRQAIRPDFGPEDSVPRELRPRAQGLTRRVRYVVLERIGRVKRFGGEWVREVEDKRIMRVIKL